MSKIIFIDANGQALEMEVSEFCKATLNIQNGKVVNVEYNQSVRMQPPERVTSVEKRV